MDRKGGRGEGKSDIGVHPHDSLNSVAQPLGQIEHEARLAAAQKGRLNISPATSYPFPPPRSPPDNVQPRPSPCNNESKKEGRRAGGAEAERLGGG